MVNAMENELRDFLVAKGRQYAEAANCALSTVGRRCRNDSAFFNRIACGDGSFTVRTFDEVIGWFDENWPADSEKPDLQFRGVSSGPVVAIQHNREGPVAA